MKYECTDCKHCADFEDGYRVFCLHPDYPPDEVIKYEPVGDRNAEFCGGFEDDTPYWFTGKDLSEAETYSEEKYQDVTYEGIREWCLSKIEEWSK